ncbi:MAG: tyrosine-type recombinase/integrase [Candidatus Bathyarchaeia archaeon]|nr:tyrosine-type recombinase/integrase [Candidatus Bathyarchaeia archaeon]
MSVKLENKSKLKAKEKKLPKMMASDLIEFRKYLETYPSRIGKPRSKATIKMYLDILKRLVRWLDKRGVKDFKDVSARELEEFIINYECKRYVWGKGRRRIYLNKPIGWQFRNIVITTVMMFYKWLYRDDPNIECPQSVRNLGKLEARPPLDERSRVKEASELLTDEELLSLLKACETGRTSLQVKRDRCLVSILYESGCRACEILNLENGDIKATEYGFKIEVRGKTGRRTIPIIDSAKYLLEWVNVHPKGNNPNVPLFVSISKNHYLEKLTRTGLYGIIKGLAKKAGIKKRVYPHLFRHTRATELSAYTSEAYLRKIQGWTKSSTMPAFYIKLSGKDVEREVLRMHGLAPMEQLKPILESKNCWSCGYKNGPHNLWCTSCGKPLKGGARIVAELGEAHNAVTSVKKLEKRMMKLENAVTKMLKSLALYMGPGMLNMAEDLGVRQEAEAVAKELRMPQVRNLVNLKVKMGE